MLSCSGGTVTYSKESWTGGGNPVTGYNGTNYARLVTSGQSAAGDLAYLSTKLENAVAFIGQPITISFWAKAASGTPTVAVAIAPNQSGIGQAYRYAGQITTSTSWARYSVTITITTATAYTAGFTELLLWTSAGSTYNSFTGSMGIQSATIDFWGIQVEAGSVATAFKTASGSIQGELALCQRYYYLHASGNSLIIANGGYYSASQVNGIVNFPVSMRIPPSLVATSGTDFYVAERNSGTDTFNSFTIYRPTNTAAMIYNQSQASGTAGNAALLYTNNASASVAFNAEF
jgi:hypothetical protein